MTGAWSIMMLISGALFAAGVLPIAWERAPAWRAADHATFRAEFAHTLRRMDRGNLEVPVGLEEAGVLRRKIGAGPAGSRSGPAC
jgi:hypothetical protein